MPRGLDDTLRVLSHTDSLLVRLALSLALVLQQSRKLFFRLHQTASGPSMSFEAGKRLKQMHSLWYCNWLPEVDLVPCHQESPVHC